MLVQFSKLLNIPCLLELQLDEYTMDVKYNTYNPKKNITCADVSISRVPRFTNTVIRPINVPTFSFCITCIGIQCALVNVW